MLFSLTGASGAGKSTILDLLRVVDWEAEMECVEFDSIGVPDGAETAWRHGAVETWVQRAVAAQDNGAHMLLCGQIPMGELLAAPSANLLEHIEVCVLHCSPAVRRERLLRRGADPDAIVHHNRFGEWFLGHSLDPTHSPEVVRVASGVPMEWSRWADYEAGDPRWRAEIVDTDLLTPAQTASIVEAWVRRELTGSAR